jgi:hypothetical protein
MSKICLQSRVRDLGLVLRRISNATGFSTGKMQS